MSELCCDHCGTTSLPGGLGACQYTTGCCVCEDCLCKKCDSIDTCEKHCGCEYDSSESDEDE